MCLGPCDDKQLEAIYNKNFNLLKDIFTGRVGYFKKIVEEKMIEFAKKEMFEQASFLRDELERLSTNNYYEYRNSESLKNTDVIGIITKNNQIQISILFFRGGYIIDKADLFAISKIQNIQYEQYQMLKQFYSLKSSVPKKIIIDNQFEYFDDLKIDLKNLELFDTKFEKISKGRKFDLIKLAKKNAEISLENNIQNEKRIAYILQNLKENLSLSSLPKRIECFDISNTQGTNPVASMVVFSNCEPDKSKYRKFKINSKGPNDYEMMKEAIQRRLKRIDEEGWEKPDLILIDGGKGHLNKISPLVPKNINVASIAKPLKKESIDKIYIPNMKNSIKFDKDIDSLNILINLRNEAHRFAITFHKSRRSKEMLSQLKT